MIKTIFHGATMIMAIAVLDHLNIHTLFVMNASANLMKQIIQLLLKHNLLLNTIACQTG